MNATCARAAQIWPASERRTAYGVCVAESHGDPNAHCFNCAGVVEDSRGIFQDNVDAHPQYAALNLYDPTVSARAAYQIWKSSGWGAWSTYTDGSYLKYAGDYVDGGTIAPSASPSTPPWLFIGAGVLLLVLIRHHGG